MRDAAWQIQIIFKSVKLVVACTLTPKAKPDSNSSSAVTRRPSPKFDAMLAVLLLSDQIMLLPDIK